MGLSRFTGELELLTFLPRLGEGGLSSRNPGGECVENRNWVGMGPGEWGPNRKLDKGVGEEYLRGLGELMGGEWVPREMSLSLSES